MKHLYHSCITHPTPHNTLVLLHEFRYKNITVPKGYETNGADIPRLFWSIIPPFAPALIPAIVIHDYLCDIEQYDLADKAFAFILKDLGVCKAKRWVLVKAVVLYHKLRYGTKCRV